MANKQHRIAMYGKTRGRLEKNGWLNIFSEAFYSTFTAIDDEANANNYWLHEDKNHFGMWFTAAYKSLRGQTLNPEDEDALKLYNPFSVFTGYSAEDAEKKRNPIVVFGLRVFRTAENLLKLVTEFPIKLVDYTVEKVYADLVKEVKKQFNGPQIPFILLTITFVVGLVHIAVKTAATLTRLIISPVKVWREADALDKEHKPNRKFGPRGIAARVVSAAAITVFCVFFPPFAAKVAPLIANAAGSSTVFGALAPAISSVGSGIGWIASTLTQGAAAGVYAGLTTAGLITGFSLIRDKISRIGLSSKKATKEGELAKTLVDDSHLINDPLSERNHSNNDPYAIDFNDVNGRSSREGYTSGNGILGFNPDNTPSNSGRNSLESPSVYSAYIGSPMFEYSDSEDFTGESILEEPGNQASTPPPLPVQGNERKREKWKPNSTNAISIPGMGGNSSLTSRNSSAMNAEGRREQERREAKAHRAQQLPPPLPASFGRKN